MIKLEIIELANQLVFPTVTTRLRACGLSETYNSGNVTKFLDSISFIELIALRKGLEVDLAKFEADAPTKFIRKYTQTFKELPTSEMISLQLKEQAFHDKAITLMDFGLHLTMVFGDGEVCKEMANELAVEQGRPLVRWDRLNDPAMLVMVSTLHFIFECLHPEHPLQYIVADAEKIPKEEQEFINDVMPTGCIRGSNGKK